MGGRGLGGGGEGERGRGSGKGEWGWGNGEEGFPTPLRNVLCIITCTCFCPNFLKASHPKH